MRYLTTVGTERLFTNPFHPQGNAKVENIHSFIKRTLTKFLDSSNLEWDELLQFTCYCYNIFPGSDSTESPIFLMFGWDPAEGCLSYLNNSNRYYDTNKGKIWKKCTNCGITMPTTLGKCIKEMSTRMFQSATVSPHLKLASWSRSGTMTVIHLNQSIW